MHTFKMKKSHNHLTFTSRNWKKNKPNSKLAVERNKDWSRDKIEMRKTIENLTLRAGFFAKIKLANA